METGQDLERRAGSMTRGARNTLVGLGTALIMTAAACGGGGGGGSSGTSPTSPSTPTTPTTPDTPKATLEVASATGRPGDKVDALIKYTAISTPATPAAAMVFDFNLPSKTSYVSVTPGSSATSAGKDVQVVDYTSRVRTLIASLTTAEIPSGPLMTVKLGLASDISTGSYRMFISDASISDPTGLKEIPYQTIDGNLTVTAGLAAQAAPGFQTLISAPDSYDPSAFRTVLRVRIEREGFKERRIYSR
jgi:hypothetical protein